MSSRSDDPNPHAAAHWFAENVRPHEGLLRNYIRAAFPHLRDPDDVVQETYLRILKVRETKEILNVRAFLLGIGRNVALETLRKRRFLSDIPVNELPETVTQSSTPDVVDTVIDRQERALVTEAIQGLPDRCREIVALRTLHGLSYSEIAQKLGLAEETVRVQMARGIRKCVAHLKERGITPQGEIIKLPSPAPDFGAVPRPTT